MDISVEQVSFLMPRILRICGRLHMVGASTLVNNFGPDGELMVRQWLRRFGFWRGKEMRKGHMSLGLPINVETLMKNWDSAASFHLEEKWKTEAYFSPYNVKTPSKRDEGGCPMSDPWIENDFWQWGHVLCDELHIQIARGYHPDAVVVIPVCIMKREDRCEFNWVMPPDARKPEPIDPYPGQDVLNDWKINNEKDKAVKCLRRSMRVAAARSYFLWEVLSEYRPMEAVTVFNRIMKEWAASRATALKKEIESNGWGTDANSLLSYYDYPYEIVWGINKEVKPNGIEIEVSYCPFAETWGWLGGLNSMQPYCENCYSVMSSNGNPKLTANVLKCKTRGDKNCLIHIKKAD